ncbi:MAG TPA: branched-chain amino acid ABC transporter permease [Syntrophorhabdaceae bacterium]|nr:branched-chain amino acid ABC transporter permease [Syntrophorhabdaceae bacterium]
MVRHVREKRLSGKDAAWLGFIILLLILPLIPTFAANSFRMHIMILIMLFASMAQAWNIIGGYCGQVSFGHSVFFGIGAYGAGMAVVTYGGTPWLGILIGMIIAACVAVIISYPCFKLSGHYFAIATFAIVEIFNRVFLVWDWIGGALGLDYPIIAEGIRNIMWHSSKTHYYYCALVIFIIIFGIVRWLEGHRFGYYMRAVKEGQETAESLGVNSTAVKLTAMALSASMAALCGAFFVQYNLRVDPPMVMSLDTSMKFVLVTILGGSGTLAGPLLGAAVLIPLQEYTRAFWGGLGGGVDLIIFGLLIILMVIKQPAGMIGILHYLQKKLVMKKRTNRGIEEDGTP